MKTLIGPVVVLIFALVPQHLDAQAKGRPKFPPKLIPVPKDLPPSTISPGAKELPPSKIPPGPKDLPSPKDAPSLQELLDKQKGETEARKPAAEGDLTVAGINAGGVGAGGKPQFISAKVIQVLDGQRMLVALEDARTSTGQWKYWVMLKYPTKGFVEGQLFGPEWDELIGKGGTLKVTGTTTHKPVGGATKTLYVLERGVAEEPAAHPLVGRWKLVDDKGVVSSYLTVTSSGAKRDDAPDAPGTWDVVNGEARITWADGSRDVLQLRDGKITMLSLGKTSTWDSPVQLRLQVLRIPTVEKK